MSKHMPKIKILIAILALVLIAYFISSELRKNSVQFADVMGSVDWSFLVLSVISLCVFYFFSSMALRYLLNNDSTRPKLAVVKSFGVLNISGLAKYLPGRIWAYTLMVTALKERGIPLSKVMFDSLIHLILIAVTPFLLMLPTAVFLFLPSLHPALRIGLIVAGVAIYAGCLIASPFLLMQIVSIINRFRKQPIAYEMVRRRDVVMTQAIVLFAYIFYIWSAMCIVYSIDKNVTFLFALQTSIICMFSKIIGFLAIIVPAGLGVQESLIYYLTGLYSSDISFTLILPVILRMVTIVADVLVFLLAFWVIRKDAAGMIYRKSEG